MKKAFLGLAALTGAAVVSNSADAARIVLNNTTFADFGVQTQIYAQSLDKAANNNNDRATDFAIQNARIYFYVQLNPAVKFVTNFDFPVTGAKTSHEATSTAKVRDAYVNIGLNPLLQGTNIGKQVQQLPFTINVMAGYNRVPFSRETLTPRYERIFMPQDGWLNVQGESYNNTGDFEAYTYKDQILKTLYVNAGNYVPVQLTTENVMGAPTLGNAIAMTGKTDEADYSRDAGLTFWGNIANYATYYVGIYDSFGDHNAAETVADNGKDNLGYIVRFQFNVMSILGATGIISPEAAKLYSNEGQYYYVKETYLGQKNVATLGLSYARTKLDIGRASFTFKSWGIDYNTEFAYGVWVPKISVAYVQTDGDNLPLTDGTNNFNLDKVKTLQYKVGVLYNQVVGLGKPGIYLKYEKVKIQTNGLGDIQPTVWALAIPYYLANQNAKVVLQWNHYDYDKSAVSPRGNSSTANDYTLAFQFQF
jgi:hypothetical protein